MIEAENLCKVFQDKKRGTVRAVDGVSFVCKPGQIYGLLGANGAGKTTTLRMLATILEPTDGTARVAGFDVMTDAQKVRANIGFLSTSTALYGRLSAYEMVQYFGRLHGLEDDVIDQRINALFGRLEMNEFRDRRCDKLSTGMKQKTAIARTMLHDPPILILDEPTSGLDVPTARAIETTIIDAKKAGKCVLYSTHVMEEAEYLCDRIGVINDGKLKMTGTMDELRAATGKQRLREIFLDLLGLAA